MTQRYTTFIPGYVFNIFEPLYTCLRAYPYTYTFILLWPVLYYYSLSSSEPILRKNFFEQSAQYRIEPEGPSLLVFYELIKHISISLFTSHKMCLSAFSQVIRCVQQKFSAQHLDKSLNNKGLPG